MTPFHHPATSLGDVGNLGDVGDTLRAHAFGDLVETARDAGNNRREPWLPAQTCAVPPLPGVGIAATMWVRLTHLREPVAVGDLTDCADAASAVAPLVETGLAVETGGQLLPGEFALTSSRGLLAAADRDYGAGLAEVHLGEDSLRFTDAVLAAAPRGRVVEVGTGSGLAAAAAARTGEHVTAVDVLPRALDAARLTAGLNRVADRIDLDVADFRDWTPSGSVDVVIANLPGVPVPAEVAYPTAGDGGPDGLALIRPLWHWAVQTLADGGSGRKAGQGRLVMRFQALGDDTRPAVLTELREVFGRDADITVVTDSRVPTLVRNAITAVRAAALAGHDSPLPLLARITAGTDAIGSAYHCSTLHVDLAGCGRTTHSFTGTDLRLDSVPRDAVDAWTAAESLARSRALAAVFASGLSGMPDEFWSVGGERAAAAVLTHLDDVVTALADGITPAGVAGDVLGVDAGDDLIAHVGAVMAVALLASRLRVGGLAAPTPMSVTATHRTPRPLAATGASIPGGGA